MNRFRSRIMRMKSSPSATSILTPVQLAAVRARSDAWGAGLVAHAWVVIGSSMALVAFFPNVAIYFLAVMLIGSRQLGLLILMHDGAHGMLTQHRPLNRILSQWLCAYPMIADMDIYRRYHLQHHARTMQDDDPDLALTGHYPISRASLRRKLLRDLTGRTGYAQRREQLTQALGASDHPWPARLTHVLQTLGPQLGANAVLFALLTAAGHPWFYLTLWVVPLLTWQQLVLRIRNIAEHAVIPDRNDPFKNARTTEASLLERAFIAPYFVNYHVEHHLLMWVPCYRLPLLRHFLIANGYGGAMASAFGYWQVLLAVTVPDAEVLVAEGPRTRAVGTFSQGYKKT